MAVLWKSSRAAKTFRISPREAAHGRCVRDGYSLHISSVLGRILNVKKCCRSAVRTLIPWIYSCRWPTGLWK
jgi:hypothetical protein